VRAILLCAGRGKRLGIEGPKCLVSIAGRTLLERHLVHLGAAGVDELTVVVGHAQAEVRRALDELAPRLRREGMPAPAAIECIFNELHPHGSLVSLQRAAHRLAPGGLWMDADVLYPAETLARLCRSPHPSAVLLDGRVSETGEEMMLAVRGGRVRRIARRVGPDWDLVGESVGFFKVDAAAAAVLARVLDREVGEGRLDQEHEAALDQAFELVPFGYERVDDLAWTEIDFPEDLAKAERIAALIDAG
jgi:choline kinase